MLKSIVTSVSHFFSLEVKPSKLEAPSVAIQSIGNVSGIKSGFPWEVASEILAYLPKEDFKRTAFLDKGSMLPAKHSRVIRKIEIKKALGALLIQLKRMGLHDRVMELEQLLSSPFFRLPHVVFSPGIESDVKKQMIDIFNTLEKGEKLEVINGLRGMEDSPLIKLSFSQKDIVNLLAYGTLHPRHQRHKSFEISAQSYARAGEYQMAFECLTQVSPQKRSVILNNIFIEMIKKEKNPLEISKFVTAFIPADEQEAALGKLAHILSTYIGVYDFHVQKMDVPKMGESNDQDKDTYYKQVFSVISMIKNTVRRAEAQIEVVYAMLNECLAGFNHSKVMEYVMSLEGDYARDLAKKVVAKDLLKNSTYGKTDALAQSIKDPLIREYMIKTIKLDQKKALQAASLVKKGKFQEAIIAIVDLKNEEEKKRLLQDIHNSFNDKTFDYKKMNVLLGYRSDDDFSVKVKLYVLLKMNRLDLVRKHIKNLSDFTSLKKIKKALGGLYV